MRVQPYCISTWKPLDTEFNDQSTDPFEGLSALFDLRRQGFLPQETPEPEPDQIQELCF